MCGMSLLVIKENLISAKFWSIRSYCVEIFKKSLCCMVLFYRALWRVWIYFKKKIVFKLWNRENSFTFAPAITGMD